MIDIPEMPIKNVDIFSGNKVFLLPSTKANVCKLLLKQIGMNTDMHH